MTVKADAERVHDPARLLCDYEALIYATIRGYKSYQRQAGWDWDDLVQTARLSLLELLDEWDPEGTVFLGYYLKRMLPYRVLNYLKKAIRRRRLESIYFSETDPAFPAPETAATRQTDADVEDWIRRSGLKTAEAETLVLIFCHDQTHAQVAEALGLQEDSVRRIKNRALTKLRDRLLDRVD